MDEKSHFRNNDERAATPFSGKGRKNNHRPGRLSPQRDLITRNFYGVILLFTVIIICLLALDRLQAHVLDSVRAYVAAESFWSKGQKDAVLHLKHYAESADPEAYNRYLESLTPALGDRQARLALQMDTPDIEMARQGFLAGRNHTDDVEKMISLFRNFGEISYMKEAIIIWTEGDLLIDKLQHLGTTLDDEIRSGAPDTARLEAIMANIDHLNTRLTDLESRFSATLGNAARKIRQLTEAIILATALLLLVLGIILSRRIVRGIHRTHAELAASEARFRHVVESNIIGITFQEMNGTITDANDAFLEMLGYNRNALERRLLNWRVLTPEGFEEEDTHAMQQLLHQGYCAPYEKLCLHEEGHPVAVYIGAALFDDAKKSSVSFVLDISQRHQLEAQLRQAQKMEAIGTLVGGIAHNFNNTLGAIEGNLYLARMHSHSNEEVKAKLDNIANLSRHSAAIVQQLMAFARKSIIQMRPISLNRFFRNLAPFTETIIPENIAFQLEICDAQLSIRGG